MHSLLRLVIALALLLVFTGGAEAKIYRWVDENGITHLDDVLDNVPEPERADAKVFQSTTSSPPPAPVNGPNQAAFANGVARELGVIAVPTQDAVSALHLVGIYPSAGWNPAAALTPAVVDEVVRSARAAARAHRLPQGEVVVEAAVLRVSSGLGIAGPPATAVAEVAPPPEPTIVIAPNIVVESPPSTVIVHTVERERGPVLTRYGWDPAYGDGVPFAPIQGGGAPGPIPDRITPLSNPAGHLRGPAVPPRPRLGPFRRPPT